MAGSESDTVPTGEPTTGVAGATRRIGVLSLHNSKETKAILNAVEALGHEPVWLREENLQLYVDDDEAIVRPDVDLVINRLLLSNAETPLADLEVATALASARPVLNPPRAVLTAIHKYATAMTLADAGLPTPNSALAFGPGDGAAETGHVTGPSVSKPAIGTHGDDARKVDDGADRPPRRPAGHTVHQSFLAQDAAQSDVRVYVVDGAVVAAMRRTSPADDWRTNVARGGSVTDATDSLPARARDLALRATSAVGLDVAGVDLMERDGWYVLEVNPTAGFRGLFEATGRSPAPRIARAAIERAGGSVADDEVADLADTLDDSVPACKPEAATDASAVRTIGVTEAVEIAGRSGSDRVVAKVDTGADRTSIDVELAAEIGAGPIEGYATVRSPTRERGRTRPLVDVQVAVADRWESVTASVEDRTHMNYPVIVGTDLLSGYRVDVDARAGDDPQAGQAGQADGERRHHEE